MNRRRSLVAMAAAALGATAVGCSGSNPNEQGFETQGFIDPDVPVDAEEYEKKFTKEPGPRKKGKRPAPTEI
jgi:hypothetical protein